MQILCKYQNVVFYNIYFFKIYSGHISFSDIFFYIRQHRKKQNAVKQLKELIIHIFKFLITGWFISQGG